MKVSVSVYVGQPGGVANSLVTKVKLDTRLQRHLCIVNKMGNDVSIQGRAEAKAEELALVQAVLSGDVEVGSSC